MRTDQAVGTGTSSAEDATTAATGAVTAALGGATPRSGDVVFVFVTVDYEPQPFVNAALAAAAPARVVTSSSLTSFATGAEGLHSVVATYVPAGNLSIGIGVAHEEKLDLYAASRDAAADAKAQARASLPHAVLMLLSGGHVGGQRQVVQGAYEVAGATVPLVGGAAASDQGMSPTWLALDDEVVPQGVIAVWLDSPEPLGVAVAHGWEPLSRPLMVTRARDNVILELDGRPAVEAYLDVRGPMAEGPGPWGWRALDRPLGLPTTEGTYEVRMIKGQAAGGGLEMFSYVHDQAILRVMGTTPDELLSGARKAAAGATAQLDRPARGALVFSCGARAALLGDRAAEECMVMADELQDIPAGGFFTSGEYAMTAGATGYHNATAVVLAL